MLRYIIMRMPTMVLAAAVALSACQTAPRVDETVADAQRQVPAEETQLDETDNVTAESDESGEFEEVAWHVAKVVILVPVVALAVALNSPHAVYHLVHALD